MNRYEWQKHICQRKRRYSKKKYAKDAIKQLKKVGRKLYWYKCCFCGDFHLTKKKQNRKK